MKRVENVRFLLRVHIILIDRLLMIFDFERFELLGMSHHAILTVNVLDSVNSLQIWFHNVPFNDVDLIPLGRQVTVLRNAPWQFDLFGKILSDLFHILVHGRGQA